MLVVLISAFYSPLCFAFIFALGSAFKVGNAVLVHALVLAGFLSIPCSGLSYVAAVFKR